MNILISTFGVRGDVQPYLALAVGLQGAGHRVTLVFPRMAAVVHHGGAGTTGAGLRAGVPTIITPFATNDQPVWAERVAALGVGLRLPGIRQLTAEKLAEAIHGAVTDSALRGRVGREDPR